MNTEPHIETMTGAKLEVIDGQHPAGPIVEHHGLPSAEDLDKIQGEQIIPPLAGGVAETSSDGVDPMEVISAMHMDHRVYDSIDSWREDSIRLQKLLANAVAKNILTSMEKLLSL